MLFTDDAALTAHTESALQQRIRSFAQACSDFGLTIRFKATNIRGQDFSFTSSISIGDYTLEVVKDFTYLGFTISSDLSLDTELNKRISKAAAALARLGDWVWDNTQTNTFHLRCLRRILGITPRIGGSTKLLDRLVSPCQPHGGRENS